MRRNISEQRVPEAQLREEQKEKLSEMKEYGNRLYEKWSKKRNLGEGFDRMMDSNPDKARSTSIILENQEKHLQQLTETQISSAFQTTPENVLRIVRLGYPNSVRGEIFHEFPMVTARDSIYYLDPVYTDNVRGATAEDVTHESDNFRYASEIEEDQVGTGDGSTSAFTATLSNAPLRRFSVKVLVAQQPVAVDDGSGNLVGDALDSAAANTVNYTSGAVVLNFDDDVDSGATVIVQYHFDSEEPTQYDDIQSVQIRLRDYQFRAKPWPLYVSWSKMTELLLGTTLDIDTEEALITGAGDELKKALDFHAVRMGYRYSLASQVTTFDADFATLSNNEKAHAQGLTRTIAQASKVIYNQLQRGGVNTLVVGTDVAAYLTLHDQWSSDGQQPEIGIYRLGTLLGKPVYQAPNNVVPANEILGVWRNPSESGDVALAFGTLVALYRTQTLEFKEAYTQSGLFHFGDWRALNSRYLIRIRLTNL